MTTTLNLNMSFKELEGKMSFSYYYVYSDSEYFIRVTKQRAVKILESERVYAIAAWDNNAGAQLLLAYDKDDYKTFIRRISEEYFRPVVQDIHDKYNYSTADESAIEAAEEAQTSILHFFYMYPWLRKERPVVTVLHLFEQIAKAAEDWDDEDVVMLCELTMNVFNSLCPNQQRKQK